MARIGKWGSSKTVTALLKLHGVRRGRGFSKPRLKVLTPKGRRKIIQQTKPQPLPSTTTAYHFVMDVWTEKLLT